MLVQVQVFDRSLKSKVLSNSRDAQLANGYNITPIAMQMQCL